VDKAKRENRLAVVQEGDVLPVVQEGDVLADEKGESE
jgi:hypothetical protein